MAGGSDDVLQSVWRCHIRWWMSSLLQWLVVVSAAMCAETAFPPVQPVHYVELPLQRGPDWWLVVPHSLNRKSRRHLEARFVQSGDAELTNATWHPLHWAMPRKVASAVRWRRVRVVHRRGCRKCGGRNFGRLVHHQCGLLGIRVGEASHPGPSFVPGGALRTGDGWQESLAVSAADQVQPEQ